MQKPTKKRSQQSQTNRTFVCQYEGQAVLWSVRHPAGAVGEKTMLQYDGRPPHALFRCVRLVRYPMHVQEVAVLGDHLVHLASVPAEADDLGLHKKRGGQIILEKN